MEIQCPKCNGDGLYKRHTSYTENGIPVCFPCKGSGKIDYTGPKFSKLYKVEGRLMSHKAKKLREIINKPFSFDEIPF